MKPLSRHLKKRNRTTNIKGLPLGLSISTAILVSGCSLTTTIDKPTSEHAVTQAPITPMQEQDFTTQTNETKNETRVDNLSSKVKVSETSKDQKDTEMATMMLEDISPVMSEELVPGYIVKTEISAPESTVTVEPPQPRIVNFGFDQFALSEEDKKVLDIHGVFLATHPNYLIQIHGHSDLQGHPVYNHRLSEQRAKTVARMLTAAGARPEQIETFAWGSREPLYQGLGNAQNRRVEMIYLDEQVAETSPTPFELISEVVSNDID